MNRPNSPILLSICLWVLETDKVKSLFSTREFRIKKGVSTSKRYPEMKGLLARLRKKFQSMALGVVGMIPICLAIGMAFCSPGIHMKAPSLPLGVSCEPPLTPRGRPRIDSAVWKPL